MRNYELTIVLPDTTEVTQKKVLERVEKLVSNVSGKVLETASWGKKDLFYPIAKQNQGVYYFLNLAIPAEGVAIVNREVQLDSEVLRHLLVVADDKKVEQVVQVEKVEKAEKPKNTAKAKKAAKKDGK
ncbi:MAG: 30S ribosomal protein S6 [Patescibacteria group bacterium]